MSQVSANKQAVPTKCVVVKDIAKEHRKNIFIGLLKSFAIPFKAVFIHENDFVIKPRAEKDVKVIVDNLTGLSMNDTTFVVEVHDISEFPPTSPEQKSSPSKSGSAKNKREEEKEKEKKDTEKVPSREGSEPRKFVIKRANQPIQKKNSREQQTVLVISNLPHYITKEDVETIVEQKCSSIEIDVKENRGTTAVVRFNSEDELHNAYNGLKEDAVEVDDQPIKVELRKL